ncbi:hypothetical protein FRY74_06135 [Vicingus serpentipes]|uniref:Uncharacterized protein n=1 Tax=Vicingus serpentipes TaxID=1926625 RepID=A0A5C6RUW0_9FLAO|nr:hypothetical protein [Vicingus serpentipes]TXB66148.1 hypothetical protein FRY74_06135 [Vicingus serpentipes]
MDRVIRKYYKDENGRPLFCIIVNVLTELSNDEVEFNYYPSIHFSFPFFDYYKYEEIKKVTERIENLLFENPYEVIDDELSELATSIKNEEDLSLLYFPDFLITKDNMVCWSTFNSFLNGYEGQYKFDQFAYNLSNRIGDASLCSNTTNQYLFNVLKYLLLNPISPYKLVESNIKYFMNYLPGNYQDMVLDNFQLDLSCFEIVYELENDSRIYLLRNNNNEPIMFCNVKK